MRNGLPTSMDTHTYKLKAAIFISPFLRRVHYNLATPLPPGIYIVSEKFLVGERRAIKIIFPPQNYNNLFAELRKVS